MITASDVPVIDIQTVYEYCRLTHATAYNTLPCVRSPFDRCELRCRMLSSSGDRHLIRFYVSGDGSAQEIKLDLAWGEAKASMELDDLGAVSGHVTLWSSGLPADARAAIDSTIQCVLNALNFMHVKGARIDAPEHASRQARRSWERSKQKIHVLRLEPLERFVRDAQAGSATMRAHLVRGHFKDFRNGAGVGGNPNARGIYWTPAHVRGDAKLGIVAKQYETGEVA